MCGGSKPKAPPPPPEPLKQADQGMAEARDSARKRQAAVAGMANTKTTGQLGQSYTTGKTLLGA